MSIAEKLTTIAENQQRVYDKGYADGLNSAPTGPTGIPTYCGIPYWNALGEAEVVLDLPSRNNFTGFMQQQEANTTVEHLTLNGPQDATITSIERCFFAGSLGNAKLKRLTLNCDFSKCTSFASAFSSLGGLEVIDGTPIDFSSTTVFSGIFSGCYKLKELRVKPQTIKKTIDVQHLSAASNDTIQSIVDGLADLTGKTQQTIDFGYDNSSNVTEAQREAISKKNWKGVYRIID